MVIFLKDKVKKSFYMESCLIIRFRKNEENVLPFHNLIQGEILPE